MKLADEIIASLSSEKSSLTDALLKTKVLLHKIGHKELVEWVNFELNGYPNSEELPSYRILPAQVLANVASVAYQFNSHPIPIGHLTPKQREGLEKAKMHEALAVLEKLVGKDHANLRGDIPMEAYGVLEKQLAPGLRIQRAWSEIGVANVSNIFIQVRSRLLDFILELNEKLPGDLDEAEIKKRSNTIDAPGMFKNAIFGDNVTIVIGDSNAQTVHNISVKGNFSVLANEMRRHNVPENDIQNLEISIKKDEGQVSEQHQRLGPAVKNWIDSMLTKAADASWQIELNIAAGILTTALQNYYGWLK